MQALIPYIVFPGNCKEAMEFYTAVFEGELTKMQTYEHAPMPVPPEYQGRIFDSELQAQAIRIKASDDLPGHGAQVGTNISLFVSFSDELKRKEVFRMLAEEGKVLFPLDDNFGMLKDRYNIQWMFVLTKE